MPIVVTPAELTATVVKGTTFSFEFIVVNVERVPQNYASLCAAHVQFTHLFEP